MGPKLFCVPLLLCDLSVTWFLPECINDNDIYLLCKLLKAIDEKNCRKDKYYFYLSQWNDVTFH